jgi:spore coat polysaccharide biosynthesis protein SpsF
MSPLSDLRTVIIAQARMGSTRLPGKVMMKIAGRPIIDHVIERARRSRVDEVVVAIPDLTEDDVLDDWLRSSGVHVFRGSSDDVLSRYAGAAAEAGADVVVRITCDCPLIDPKVIDAVLDVFEGDDAEYCSNTLERSYPIGMDTEVFSRRALERADSEATRKHEREHVTPYLYRNPDLFRLRNVRAPEWARRPDLRLTVDEQADYDMISRLLEYLPESGAGLEAVLDVLKKEPRLEEINRDVHHRHLSQ